MQIVNTGAARSRFGMATHQLQNAGCGSRKPNRECREQKLMNAEIGWENVRLCSLMFAYVRLCSLMFAYVRLIREKSLRALRAAIAGWWKPGRIQISHRECFDKSH